MSSVGNTALHVSWALRHRRYDPGVVTSLVTLLPVGVVGLWKLWRDPAVSPTARRAGLIGGLGASGALMPALKWRLRRARTG